MYHVSTNENLQVATQQYEHLQSTLQIGVNTLLLHRDSVARIMLQTYEEFKGV